jgi:ADP-ribosyl-[dinitrogen reductase] hydrolase
MAESLIECKTHDAHDQLRRYADWFRNGHLSSNGTAFDIGKTFREGVFKHERDPSIEYPGITNPNNCGNGSLMKVAAIPMFFGRNFEAMMEFAELSSRTTHQAPTCLQACQFYSILINAALNGVEKEEFLSESFIKNLVPNYEEAFEKILHVVKGSYKVKEPPEIKVSSVNCCFAAESWISRERLMLSKVWRQLFGHFKSLPISKKELYWQVMSCVSLTVFSKELFRSQSWR